jgi:hypothetical protein
MLGFMSLFFRERTTMNKSFRTFTFGIVVTSVILLSIGSSMADFVATFDSTLEGWDGDGPSWVSTGGQDGGYASFSRYGANPYIVPATGSALYGDIADNIGSSKVEFSYYLKNISGSPNSGCSVAVFSDTDATAGWDTLWIYTPSDTSVPAEWRHYSWTVDTAAASAPNGWTLASGSGTWANSWDNVVYWNLWTSTGSGTIVNGIDTVRVSAAVPEPASALLTLGGLFALLAYAWRKRK